MKRIEMMAGMVAGMVCLSAYSFAGLMDENPTDVGMSLKIGTLGYGADATIGLTERFNARLGFNMFNYEMTESDEDDDGGAADEITAEIDFLTLPVLIDWHPWSGRFRLSGGIVFNNNEITLSAIPGDTIELGPNDREYAVDSLDGKASFGSVAPYLGIGVGNAVGANGNWHFAMDIGVMFQGSPEIELSAVALNPAEQAALDRDIDEEVAEIEDDTDFFSMYPLISLGVSYKF